MTSLDPRVHAYRPDLADRRLEGRVAAAAFVDPWPAALETGVVGMAARLEESGAGPAKPAGPQVATKLCGEPLLVFEARADGWLWVQSRRDDYVGYIRAEGVRPRSDDGPPSLSVVVPRTLLLDAPDAKARTVAWAPLEGRLIPAAPQRVEAGFVALANGLWVFERHVSRPEPFPIDGWSPADAAAVAETLLHAPYEWGGDSVAGVDCSGLIKISLWAMGRACPRDSDQQERFFTQTRDPDGPLARGDLVFWRGHVGMMLSPTELLHANAHHMAVAREPLSTARARIEAAGGGPVTSVRRP